MAAQYRLYPQLPIHGFGTNYIQRTRSATDGLSVNVALVTILRSLGQAKQSMLFEQHLLLLLLPSFEFWAKLHHILCHALCYILF